MTTTMGELIDWQPPPADETHYQALMHTLEALYPDGWKDWVIKCVTAKDLFGETLTPDTEARLRFAVPTLRLARIFRCEKSLSERRYRTLKRKLLEWPIGLALIYQPLSIMVKVHLNGPQNKFEAMLPGLKKHLISRKEASDILKSEVDQANPTSVTSSTSAASKRQHTPDPVQHRKRQRLADDSDSAESLSEYMRQQNDILSRLCEITYGLTHQKPEHSSAPRESTSRSLANSEDDSEAHERGSIIEDSWSAPPLAEDEEPKDREEPLFDFAPETKESEAKLSKASVKMVELGMKCQKFDNDGWHNIRYADVQKMFQASPVFTALKVNGHLATLTPPWQLVSTLEKTDLCLGAITHGLLQQRTAFEETYASAPPDVKTYLGKNFLNKDKAPFRKISDSLLQYTCEKRAEAIEQRRALFKPQNKTISELLHAIPPSSTHLFAEPQLSDLIKEQGGVSKVFPGKFKRPNAPANSKLKGRQGFKQRSTFRKQNAEFQKSRHVTLTSTSGNLQKIKEDMRGRSNNFHAGQVLIDAWRVTRSMSGMTGASMLRTRRKDVNLKPNRKLDRKSSRGMLYENEELRLRTININAEVERGQSDIKKLKRENDQLKREISALRYEYDRLDRMLHERRSSPEHSDDSAGASVCSACPECACTCSESCARVAFNDLSVVPEEQEQEITKSGVESPCTCEECQAETKPVRIQPTKQPVTSTITLATTNNVRTLPNTAPVNSECNERVVDVLVHDTPTEVPRFFQAVTSPAYHTTPPPPPGFVLAPYQPPRFHTGGNVEDLLGDVQSNPTIQTTFIQQNSVFMCNTRKIMQKCCCQSQNQNQKQEPVVQNGNAQPPPKSYVTEKNIELTYDYPRATPVIAAPSPNSDEHTTTTEVASTVVFVERRIPVKPKKFDFFFRSRSAPVGENEEPIYATVNKLPKRLRRIELANLEKEVEYKAGEPDSSTRTEITLKTDSESQIPPPDDDTSRSEREKSTVPQRPDSPKAKKRKRFSLTFKKRERKRREKKKDVNKNGTAKNGIPVQVESDNERLIDAEGHNDVTKHNKHCSRHRPRNTMSSSSSGPRYKRDSYQEMTTSHSEHERTNSVCSSVNSLASACTHKSRNLSVPPPDGGSIPWCGCWGAGCI